MRTMAQRQHSTKRAGFGRIVTVFVSLLLLLGLGALGPVGPGLLNTAGASEDDQIPRNVLDLQLIPSGEIDDSEGEGDSGPKDPLAGSTQSQALGGDPIPYTGEGDPLESTGAGDLLQDVREGDPPNPKDLVQSLLDENPLKKPDDDEDEDEDKDDDDTKDDTTTDGNDDTTNGDEDEDKDDDEDKDEDDDQDKDEDDEEDEDGSPPGAAAGGTSPAAPVSPGVPVSPSAGVAGEGVLGVIVNRVQEAVADAAVVRDELPFTGLDVTGALMAAGMFLALGGGALALARRRED